MLISAFRAFQSLNTLRPVPQYHPLSICYQSSLTPSPGHASHRDDRQPLSAFRHGEPGWASVLQCPLIGRGGIGGTCFLRSLNRQLSHIVVTAAPKQRCKLPFTCLFVPPVFTEHFAGYGGTDFVLENFTVDKTSQEHRSE